MTRILMPLRLIHISAPYVIKVLVFQKISENILYLLICTALSSTFLLVKLLQVAYILRSFEGFVVHPFEIERSQSGL